MKIKKFNELNENISDKDQLMLYASIIREVNPTFDVTISGNYGEIRCDNIVRFHTTGPHTWNVILAYVSGMIEGLRIKK